jgi:hypothetical protein
LVAVAVAVGEGDELGTDGAPDVFASFVGTGEPPHPVLRASTAAVIRIAGTRVGIVIETSVSKPRTHGLVTDANWKIASLNLIC